MFCSDGGGEYVSKVFKAFFVEHGITHETTTPNIPEKNSMAEQVTNPSLTAHGLS
jgi:hypothetical protein